MRSSKFFRFYVKIFSILILFHNCNIYHSGNISLQQAAETNEKVRITTNQGEKFKLNRVDENDGDYYGLTKLNSKASKKLQNLGITGFENGKLYSFGLETLGIQEIQAKNYSASTLATIGISILGLAAILFTIGSIAIADGFDIWEE